MIVSFEDLYTPEGLQRIHEKFMHHHHCDDAAALENFLADLFAITPHIQALQQSLKNPYLDENHKKTQRHAALYGAPQKQDFDNLVHFDGTLRARQGFDLTDAGCSADKAKSEAFYCLYCHDRDKDSCSKGMHQKLAQGFETNPLGNELKGCPLGQKISEMNLALSLGYAIGALAIAMIDNPLILLTGSRICNACSKACIFQKQSPVDIPSIESFLVKTVLDLPYGFEIYSLLTRWNPLNTAEPLPLPPSGKKVLVAGMGPAGLNLSHHLLRRGHNVTGIDALKIEPFDVKQGLIKDTNALLTNLENRAPLGFGGVAEYGITARWNKNYLNLLFILFDRHPRFTMIDNVRLGSALTLDDAFNTYGFDHIALCLGAGKPKILDGENALPKGVHTASDFLMSLHLNKPYAPTSLANFVVRLPIAVVGGGLTSIDTATESLAYYALQVKKFKTLFKTMDIFNKDERAIAEEFLKDADALENLDDLEKIRYLQKRGGVTLITRKGLHDTPAYRLNHEEIAKALEEGIFIKNGLTPHNLLTGEDGWVSAIQTNKGLLEAKTVFYALGTSPNTLAGDTDLDFNLQENPFIIDARGISLFGDMHKKYQGSVVSAMASAKDGIPFIEAALKAQPPRKALRVLKDDALAVVRQINRLAPNIIEIVLHAPLAARMFSPGQFYRLQNYGANPFEPLALTGAEVNAEKGTLSLIALEIGASTKALEVLQIREHLSLMGPTGTKSHIPSNKKVLLVGGGLGNAVLFSIGKAMRDKGCDVTYIAGYRQKDLIFKEDRIQAAADQVIWCVENDALPHHTKGNILDGLRKVDLQNFDHILTIGSDAMMAAVKEALVKAKTCARLEASINAPMQCMMKEICGRCLQKMHDDKGNASYIFTCTNQDQNMLRADFTHLKARLNQHSVFEKVNQI